MARNPVTRRELLRSAALAGLLLPAAGALSACATPAGGGPSSAPMATGPTSAANPLGIPADKPFEVVIFDGGYGDAYARQIHEPLFTGRHPGVQIKHTATKEIAKTLQPRFAGGDPPEFVNNSGDNSMDFGALAQDGQLQDLGELLDAPSWDDPAVKVRDTILPAAIELGTYDGTYCVLEYASTVWGIWYSQKLFDDNGWQVPKTWDEFTALCETIKKSGRCAPFTYAGKHPFYIYETILTLAAKIGGVDVLKNIDNLAEGAWKAGPLTQAAEAFAEIGAKYLLQGTQGLDHIQTQTVHNKYQVAMLPCGSWLENEQKDSTPDGFGYAMFPLPSFSGSDALPYGTVHSRPGEEYFVAARSANPRAAMEYMRAMLSKEGAGRFSETLSTLTVVKGAAEGRTLTPGLRAAATALKNAGTNTTYFRFRQWYQPLHDEVAAATGQLMAGRLKPGEWADRCQKKADEIRNDSSVKKFTR
ncbi:carbohydrate ABC transporter, N-acetylglucosamine/diacetylchitobiose-binding protein [Sphaerisporangium melleum]|uniref:Carbohydrate ABC transporter, N-acetylglucosamine/diacetylchitobiose-binding protein n=1 Tax=Sphaerisporangium melleum TaxID=321316 RepID=A0A917RFU3_9ACTN|nr:N-acetylglucosamine/diacetylchitobiose ABC transporter substrate-binding protein [Sphaerisporangium melleum]GGL05760.1 carbohydrate ABC transporter, N-acetylglucosamine/diacetylchitobiose-binding protein [Sphaerisporangium melleum]GII73169.1 carbohydrate ABC transporter, N-acetylglucosamine/diacetylchitobiose-binding protein [Sphaerisporangium melleum]